MGWLKKILGQRNESDEAKVARYIELLKSLDVISIQGEELADSFRLNKSIVEDLSISGDIIEQEKRLSKFNEFMIYHKQNVHDLIKSKMKIEKEMDQLRKDESIMEECENVDRYFESKKLFKSGSISMDTFNKLIQKGKEGPVEYSDVLVFDGDGRLLILHRIQEGKSDEGGEWCIPGGHVDYGESHRDAAERELKEETGLKLNFQPSPIGFYQDRDSSINYYRAFTDDKQPSVMVDSTEHDGVEWIELKDLDKYDFIFNMKDNIKKLTGMEEKESKGPETIEILAKALKEGKITPSFFKEAAEKAKNKTYFSEKERGKLAKEGEAMPDGKYPIRNSQDLKDAIRLVGASSTPKNEVKSWIKKRAKELGLESELPESWREKDVEKGMGVEQAGVIARESLDGETKDDRVEKSGFSVTVSFDDSEHAELFKSMVEEIKAEGKLRMTGIDISELEKSDPGDKSLFRDYLNFIEGVKTRIKNIHWSEEDNSKHAYLDELAYEVSDFEDKFAEAGQSEFGRFGDGEIVGEQIDVNDPIELVDLLFERTEELRAILDGDPDYNGEISWIDDFLATLKQSKYRLQLH